MPADKESKRQPLLADVFVGHNPKLSVVQQAVFDRIRNRVRSARRFVFDDAGLVRAAEVMRDIPELLIREQQFARAPYDLTWIEIGNFRLWGNVIVGREPDATSDEQIGYLIDHGNVYVVSGGTHANPSWMPALLPLYYKLHQPWGFQQQIEFAQAAGMSRMQLDGFLWGETIYKLVGSDVQNSSEPTFNSRALREHHTCDLLPTRPSIDRAHTIRLMTDGSAGDLRNVIGLLLLLNRPSLTRYVREVGHHRGFIKGKLRPYLSHTVVTIPVDPVPTLRKIGTAEGEGIIRRRHEVRGHYCHDWDAREYAKIGCVHEWEVMPHPDDDIDDPNHWQCKICDGKRWWRLQHERGTAQIGFVAKHYEVS
jgi:hypothetical protein